MGRSRLVLKKIDNKTYRHITFAKRKTGLLKKACELSTLCDVEVALIIFSPAGKLILFEAKKRVEEIVSHFLDSPARKHGWVQNQELIRRMISQMNREASLHYHHSTCPGNCRTNGILVSIDSQLKDVQKQILTVTSQLQDVENELQYFMKSPGCIKSPRELEYREKILERTLQVVCMRKEALEAQNSIQPTLESYQTPFYPQASSSHGSSLSSGSYNLMDWPSQSNFQFPGNFARPNGFQPLRNGPETLAGLPPFPITYLQKHGYLAGNEMSRQPDQVANNMLNPESGIVNFSQTMDTMQQATASTCTALQSMGCDENYSNLDSVFWFPH